ncbi:putative GNAT family acetyltransferase [Silvimonas terrae]|uniref:Putative GNAT family acetyltransferase n=1 Tax=Silvimonas terrae TaxID=300266 RepID=A0A840RMW6_9NEIS|nr:GNAT family N-acetyltransferase [Silvimonas terrae]MBB5193532.1 putative GNAT family acetyltransferase [Silvimonas terrae]
MTHIERHSDPQVFATLTGAWLGTQYADHNQLYNAILRNTPQAMAAFDRRMYLIKRADAIVGACMITGPLPVQSIMMTDLDEEACAALVAAMAEDGITPTDIVGPMAHAWLLARFFPGYSSHVHTALGNFQLVTGPVCTGAAGVLRQAGVADQAWLVQHWFDFCQEAGIAEPVENVVRRIQLHLDAPVNILWIWEVDGTAVALCAASHQPPLSRIGPVYTLPPYRGRGYAGAMVAAVSRMVRARGVNDIFLFTDLANPTSNGVYKRVGFAQIGEHVHLELTPEPVTATC